MTIQHIVLFQFKDDASPGAVKETCANMIALKDNCIHPTSQSPYIKSMSGGKDNSPEGRQNGLQYGFIVEFGSKEDRDYYVAKDPAHQAFVKKAMEVLVNATVLDYTPGQF